jgi:hypothetical protein
MIKILIDWKDCSFFFREKGLQLGTMVVETSASVYYRRSKFCIVFIENNKLHAMYELLKVQFQNSSGPIRRSNSDLEVL